MLSNGTNQTTYWATKIDATTWGNETSSQTYQAVVDSGGFANYLPADIANKVNALFDPPGKLNGETGFYDVDCTASPPANVGIQIGGQMFNIDSADLIFRLSEEGCMSR